MDFPRFPYNPLRPQTTIAIDQVNTTKSDTQPSVNVAIVLLSKSLQNVSNTYDNGKGLLILQRFASGLWWVKRSLTHVTGLTSLK